MGYRKKTESEWVREQIKKHHFIWLDPTHRLGISSSFTLQHNKSVLANQVKVAGYRKTMERLNALWVLNKNRGEWGGQLTALKHWLEETYRGY